MTSLNSLPFDVSEHILCSIDTHRDLISLATTSSHWKERVVPSHSDYRVLRMSNRHPEVWRHLAQRPDLARTIREVTLRESDVSSLLSGQLKPERYPVVPRDVQPQAVVEDICVALRNMSQLLSLTWVGPWDPHGLYYDVVDYPHNVFDVLRHSNTLLHLEILDTRLLPIAGSQDGPPEASDDYPLWRIGDLQTISFRQLPSSQSREATQGFFGRSLNLSNLLLHHPIDPSIYETLHFPNLLCVELSTRGAFGNFGERGALQFLEKHVTVEELTWYPVNTMLTLRPGSLPALRKLITSDKFAWSVVTDFSVARPLECISQLSLNEATLAVLATIDGSRLRDLRIWKYSGLRNIHQLAELFPNLEVLEAPTLGISTREDADMGYTADDYIDALSRFGSLQTLAESSIWSLIRNEGKLGSLATRCNKLERLGHYDLVKRLPLEIVIMRGEDGSVDWREDICYLPEWSLV
ncbi:F-box domain-containing protein [Mycena kentingensis (nom. inval.)]|nr:F-box domain-containing protein [Mycena kentingensis (nom. inval.)]